MKDFNFTNANGDTALYVAARKNPHPDAIKLMLESTKKLNDLERQTRFTTAWAFAVSHNANPEVLKVFIDAGPSLRREILDPYDNAINGTPLFLAAKYNPNIEVGKFLLEL